MKLRWHPKLRVSLGALSPWPPLWTGSPSLAEGGPPCNPEQGLLTKVEALNPKSICLTADFQGVKRQGILQSRDATFMVQLYRKLEPGCLGMSIRAIGDLELTF
jgi:hypothetical protein